MMLRKHLLEKNQENEPSKLVLSKRSDKNLRWKEKEASDASGFKAEDDKHDRLTNEMLQLASNMKQNFTIAGNVKDDNLVSFYDCKRIFLDTFFSLMDYPPLWQAWNRGTTLDPDFICLQPLLPVFFAAPLLSRKRGLERGWEWVGTATEGWVG